MSDTVTFDNVEFDAERLEAALQRLDDTANGIAESGGVTVMGDGWEEDDDLILRSEDGVAPHVPAEDVKSAIENAIEPSEREALEQAVEESGIPTGGYNIEEAGATTDGKWRVTFNFRSVNSTNVKDQPHLKAFEDAGFEVRYLSGFDKQQFAVTLGPRSD